MIVDIGIYSHRLSYLAEMCARSIVRHTNQSYNLIIVCEPGSCHQNMNRVLDRSTQDILILMDEDVQILQDNWLDLLVSEVSKPKIGVVGTFVARNADARNSWMEHPENPGDWPREREWIPAHVMCFDMRKCRDFLRFDESIPWIMGMTDVDACVQLKSNGLKRMVDGRVVVYHPTRDRDEDRRREKRPTIKEQEEHYLSQVNYMMDKWGPLMVNLRSNEPLEV